MSASVALIGHLGALLDAPLSRAEAAKARLILADTIGCIIGGLDDAEVAALRLRIPPACVPGGVTGVRHAPGDAAMLLGFAAAALELDEGHYEAGGHPAAPVAAALLAEVPDARSFDNAMIRAFVLGYEAAARVGRSVGLRPEVHPHGTWGVVGAAVAVAALRGIPVSRWPDLVDLAASLATPTSSATPLLGGTLRSALIGVSARNGLLACDLLMAGVGVGQGTIERTLGGILGTGCVVGKLATTEEPRLMLMTNFMKLEASCRETQGALAALDAALGGREVDPFKVKHLRMETFQAARLLSSKTPVNATAARFSIPAVIAARLLQGHIHPDSFSPELLNSAQFQHLTSAMDLMPIKGEKAGSRQCRLEVTFSDGTILTGQADYCAGDPLHAFPNDTLRQKFLSLTQKSGHVIGKELWGKICSNQTE